MVVDVFYRTPRFIGADEKVLLDGDRRTPVERRVVGGVVLNHLGWARVLGLKVGIFGKIGDDANGALLRSGMGALGIEHHLTLNGSASSFSQIFLDRKGNRAVYMARGASGELTPAEILKYHFKFMRRAGVITTEISQLPLATVNAILLLARNLGTPTVLDVDVRLSDACPVLGSRGQLERALRLATVLKPTIGAARDLAGKSAGQAVSLAEAIRTRYRNAAVVITDGPRGCAIAARETRLRVPAFKAKQIDATGAGDAFMGAMLAGLRWGLDWLSIGRLANAAGALCVRQLGAFPAGIEAGESIKRIYGRPLPGPRLPGTQAASCAGPAQRKDSLRCGPYQNRQRHSVSKERRA